MRVGDPIANEGLHGAHDLQPVIGGGDLVQAIQQDHGAAAAQPVGDEAVKPFRRDTLALARVLAAKGRELSLPALVAQELKQGRRWLSLSGGLAARLGVVGYPHQHGQAGRAQVHLGGALFGFGVHVDGGDEDARGAVAQGAGQAQRQPARQGGLAAARVAEDDQPAVAAHRLCQVQRLALAFGEQAGTVALGQGGHQGVAGQEAPAPAASLRFGEVRQPLLLHPGRPLFFQQVAALLPFGLGHGLGLQGGVHLLQRGDRRGPGPADAAQFQGAVLADQPVQVGVQECGGVGLVGGLCAAHLAQGVQDLGQESAYFGRNGPPTRAPSPMARPVACWMMILYTV